jgi:uncharacterized integral membrane protein
MPIIVVVLIIVLIVAVFSVQNAAPVAISFLFWHFQASLAIVMFLTILCGIIIGALLMFLFRIKGQHKEKASTPKGQ